MQVVAGRHAPAVLSTDVKHRVRHQAMSFVLAGMVASLVLATFKVCLLSCSADLDKGFA